MTKLSSTLISLAQCQAYNFCLYYSGAFFYSAPAGSTSLLFHPLSWRTQSHPWLSDSSHAPLTKWSLCPVHCTFKKDKPWASEMAAKCACPQTWWPEFDSCQLSSELHAYHSCFLSLRPSSLPMCQYLLIPGLLWFSQTSKRRQSNLYFLCTLVDRLEVGTGYLPTSFSTLLSLFPKMSNSHQVWNLPIGLDLLATKSQGSSCLHLLSLGITGMCYHAWLFHTGENNLNTGPPASTTSSKLTETPLRSPWPSFLKPYIDYIISLPISCLGFHSSPHPSLLWRWRAMDIISMLVRTFIIGLNITMSTM